jgi:hypothetical protein
MVANRSRAMAAGDGLLLVPSVGQLTAFASG